MSNWRFLSCTCGILILAFLTVRGENPGKKTTDPSLVSLTGEDGKPTVRLRAYGDINIDGFEDLLVSEGLENLSQNGLSLFMYLGDSAGTYTPYDTTFGFPGRLKFESDHRGIRMWSYWHMSASEGTLFYSWLTDSGLVGGDAITIYDGDGGGSVSRAILSAYGQSSTETSLRVEKYRVVDGKAEILER